MVVVPVAGGTVGVVVVLLGAVVVDVLPPALAGGVPVAGGVIGVIPVLCWFGVLDPTPVVWAFETLAWARWVCFIFDPARASWVCFIFDPARAIWVRCMLEPEPAVRLAIRRLMRLRDAVRGIPFCFSKRFKPIRVCWSILPVTRPLKRPSDFRRSWTCRISRWVEGCRILVAARFVCFAGAAVCMSLVGAALCMLLPDMPLCWFPDRPLCCFIVPWAWAAAARPAANAMAITALNACFIGLLQWLRHDKARALPSAEQAPQPDVLHLSSKTNIPVIQCEIGRRTAV